MVKYSLGIDMSSKIFHVCLSLMQADRNVKVKATSKFKNDKEGFLSLESWLQKHLKQKEVPVVIVMEATGVYYEKCALHLYQAGYPVSVVLPNIAKKYLQSLGQKSKNDKIDAKGLSIMGAERNLAGWEPLNDFFYILRSYTRQHESLQQTKTILNNQLHAEHNRAHENKLVEQQLRQLIEVIEGQLKQLTTAIADHIKTNREVCQKVKHLCGVKGIGILTVAVIIAETNGFALFKNIPQLVSYAGYDVVEDQSGKRAGKTKISKQGNGHIRRALHMPALHAANWQGSVFQSLYQRVVERTSIKMKGYVAVQKKLLLTIYTLWKKNESFNVANQNEKHTKEQEQMLPSLVSPEADKKNSSGMTGTTQGEHTSELSQYVPSLVK